jgi:integrase
MAIEKLLALKVERERRPGLYGDGGGLYYRVAPGGTRGWIFRFKIQGRARDMGLGSVETFGLKEAREAARDCRKLLYHGIDPIEERRGRRQQQRLDSARAISFEKCAKAYIAAHEAGWRNAKHRSQWLNTLTSYVFPTLGALSVQQIDTGLVMKVIEPLWLERTETASRLRGRIEAILNWAEARGYRPGDKVNPASWSVLKNLLPAKSRVAPVKHHAALPYSNVAEFLAQIRAVEGISARALEFTVLTAVRTSDVINATWSEIDGEKRVWTIPRIGENGDSERSTKTGVGLRVALSDAALAIVQEMRGIRSSEYIFPGTRSGRPLNNMAMLLLLRRLGFAKGEVTTHGFRSSFVDWASECTLHSEDVRKMALNHVIDDKIEAAYRRGDLFEKRRQLYQDWADYCIRQPVEPPASVD